MFRPRIKRTTEPLESPDGDIRLMRPSAGVDFRVESPTEEQRELLRALDGTRTLEELEERFGAGEVGDAISRLQELELIEDAADDDRVPEADRARLDRQLRYFSDIRSDGPTPSECQERLRGARVAVLGVGGLGGWSALALACCGIGEMWLIDGDRVEVSNLNRQVLYTEADIGRPKVEVAQARLRAFDSSLRVTATARRLGSQAELADFIAGADVVLDAADQPTHEIERWCNSACFEAGIPYITMSHFPPIARVGPLFVPGRTGCFSCQEIALRREYPLYDETIERRSGQLSPAATLGPACGLIGGQVALDLMHQLTGLAEPSTLGVAHIYDLRTMERRVERIEPEPECPVCAHLQRGPAARVEEAVDG